MPGAVLKVKPPLDGASLGFPAVVPNEKVELGVFLFSLFPDAPKVKLDEGAAALLVSAGLVLVAPNTNPVTDGVLVAAVPNWKPPVGMVGLSFTVVEPNTGLG